MAGSQQYSCTSEQWNDVMLLTNQNTDITSAVCSSYNVSAVGPQAAVIQWGTLAWTQHLESNNELAWGLNTSFLLSSAYQVFMMQTGFALYAAGVVRSKNVVMILLKNFTDACIASISFYLVGYAFAFGDNGHPNGFIGNSDFALSNVESSPLNSTYAHWFWNFAFAAASTTILSGSIAERATFHSYLMYSFFMTTWVYPVVAHWMWSPNGWLTAYRDDAILKSGAIDFSGSGVVHMVGGFASLMASIVLGPRTGRFDPGVPASTFRGSSAPLYTLGTFLLWFGWYGFNPGSHQAISNYTLATGVARTAVTTTLGGGAGALSAMFTSYARHHTWDLLHVTTGALAGLVAITAGCGVIQPWAAIIAGAVAGPIFIYGERLMEKLQIDDPVGAFPVHGLCGMWGVLFVGLLGYEEYIVEVYGKPAGKHLMGIFYGGHGQLLLCQFIAILVIMAWSVFWIGSLFLLLRKLGWLRVPLVAEAMGLDQATCGDNSHGGVNPRSLTKFSDSSSIKFTIPTAPTPMPHTIIGHVPGTSVPMLANGRMAFSSPQLRNGLGPYIPSSSSGLQMSNLAPIAETGGHTSHPTHEGTLSLPGSEAGTVTAGSSTDSTPQAVDVGVTVKVGAPKQN